jgi:hypothetical protein
VGAITTLAPVRSTSTRKQTSWKVTKRTGFARVGTSDFKGSHQYSRTRTRGRTRTTDTFRYRRGIVYRRTVVQVRVTRVVRTGAVMLPIRVDAADDAGVDRVAIRIDGRTQGVDWSAGDGWVVQVPCAPGSRTITAYAYDAADNEASSAVTQHVSC